jgi:hypothetical protein
MSRRTFSLLALLLLNYLGATAQTKLVISDLEELEWEYKKRYSLLDSNEYFAYSFSVAEVTDPTGKWPILNRSICRMKNDTVNIWIYEGLGEGGPAVVINLTNEYWESFIQEYNCIDDTNYKADKSTLLVNRPNYNIGDILTGSIDITSTNLEAFKLNELTFKGKFQCAILENKKTGDNIR